MAKSILSRYNSLRHIRGAGLTGFETLCGSLNTGDVYVDSVEPTNCQMCIDAAKIVLASISKKELASCKGQQAAYVGRSL